jgi:hypothetical protein
LLFPNNGLAWNNNQVVWQMSHMDEIEEWEYDIWVEVI